MSLRDKQNIPRAKFMPEKLAGENPKLNEFERDDYFDLESHAAKGVDTLSPQQRERLVRFGEHFLEVEKNKYIAINAFKAVQDFKGLRKTADELLREEPQSYDLPRALILLEDYEGIRNLLNRSDVKFPQITYELVFSSLDGPLSEHIRKFLGNNRTPVATGGVNSGIDLIAIHNLAREYDIAVPIARGGLYQGAIANLWDMPTRIVDIAAHKRKVPKGKWVNPVIPEDFNGKKVLFFDKDAVTGASVRKALDMLASFEPEDIGIYFTHHAMRRGDVSIGTIVESLPPELKTFYPNSVEILQGAGDVYIEAHEKLGTLYGRRMLTERLFITEAQALQGQFPELSESLKKFSSEHFQAFDSLNPNLPGISEVREIILRRANQIYELHKEYLENNLYGFPGTLDNFNSTLWTTKPLPLDFELELINARYKKQADEAAQRRGVENPHYPTNPVGAFSAAQDAVKKGYDIALIVGPEGFAYEPYFSDLGVQTIAVNIPESGEYESRTIKLFDDLSMLRGKKVMVVEDDVRTGATLEKLIEHLRPHAPQRLGLYLGQPGAFQKTINIPQDFEDICIAEDSQNSAENFKNYLESKGLKIFKDINTSK